MALNVSKIRLVFYIMAAIGLADSVYLTVVKLANQPVFCGGYGGCVKVENSKYSEIGGIPVALFGIIAYLAILALLFLELKGRFWAENAPLFIFGISLAGFLYSLYLTYLEIYVIHALCFYCVISAVVITVLLILSIFRLFRGQAEAESY